MKRSIVVAICVATAGALPVDDEKCSGQGYYYTDIDECMCFSCFDGRSCEEEVPGCLVTDTLGNPEVLEEYWRNHSGAGSAAVAEVYYRTPYQYGNAVTAGNRAGLKGSLLPAFNDSVVRLHQRVGNVADPEKKNLVIGAGVTQLIAAAIFACKALYAPDKHFYVYAQPPYYSGYTSGLLGTGMANVSFTTDETLDPSQVIEFLAYPNNPNNAFNKPKYPTAACLVHDQVYFWPSLVDIKAGGAPVHTTISFFSMSKLTGHAGTRLGWALVEDEALANAMDGYVSMMSKHVSIDAQYRSYQVVNYLQNEDNFAFFTWLRGVMSTRWEELGQILANQSKLVQHAVPGAFYAWIQCTSLPEGSTCLDVFKSNGINPADGTKFGGTPDFVRLELVVPTPVWGLLKKRITSIIQS